jgi:hypothetical protein
MKISDNKYSVRLVDEALINFRGTQSNLSQKANLFWCSRVSFLSGIERPDYINEEVVEIPLH